MLKITAMKSVAILISVFSLFVIGCSKEKKYSDRHLTDVVSQNKPDKIKTLDESSLSNIKGKTVAVILGHGYNETASVSKITEELNKNFGVESEETKALVSLFVYPDDFLVSGKPRISKLGELVSEKSLCGMIILGAPEGTHSALSKIEDSTGTGSVGYPVISLFPQDDVLGTESTATFVLDYSKTSETAEVTDYIPNFDASVLLTNTIQSLITLKEPLSQPNLFKFVQTLVGKNRTVTHYIDSETNLQSINHFIFE